MVPALEERIAFDLVATPEASSAARRALLAGFAREPTRFSGDESGGWGLFLVDRIADRWAVVPTATGTCVWFEIRYGP